MSEIKSKFGFTVEENVDLSINKQKSTKNQEVLKDVLEVYNQLKVGQSFVVPSSVISIASLKTLLGEAIKETTTERMVTRAIPHETDKKKNGKPVTAGLRIAKVAQKAPADSKSSIDTSAEI